MQQQNTLCLSIIIAMEVVGSIFCLGRLSARFVAGRPPWRGLMMWSDICMGAAWLFSIGFSSTMYKVVSMGHYGYHITDIYTLFPNTDYVLVGKWFYFNTLMYNPILGLVKSSMILLYLRLGGTKRGVQTSCVILLVANCAHCFGCTIADAAQCSPLRYSWDHFGMDLIAQQAVGAVDSGTIDGYYIPTGFKDGVYVMGGHCINLPVFLLTAAGFAILTDILILAIPIYMVYDLTLKPARKAGILTILCLGICVTAIGVARFVILYQGYYMPDADAYYGIKSTVSQMETGVALVTGSIPDIYPVLRRLFPNFLRSRDSTAGSVYPYPYATGTSSYPRTRKTFTPLTSKNVSRHDKRGDEIQLDDCIWRNDQLTTGDIQVRGGAAASLDGSTEILNQEIRDKTSNGIVKTTHFTVREGTQEEEDQEKKRWSNI